MTLEKIHPVEKTHICEGIYDNYIVKSSEILFRYELYANTANIYLPCGCYTNFRDALFHFRKLAYSYEEKEIECQAFAIKEHLSRALTDAASSVMDNISFIAEKLLEDKSISDSQKQKTREMLHKMKQANLRKRFSGMMLSNDGIKIGHEDMLGLIDSFFDFANNNCKEEFAKYSHEYKQV